MNISPISCCNIQNFKGNLIVGDDHKIPGDDNKIPADDISGIKKYSNNTVSIFSGCRISSTKASLSEVLAAYNTAKSNNIDIILPSIY